MKKLLLFLLMFSITSVFSQEKIYGDFYLNQSKKEVKKVFKNNKEKYLGRFRRRFLINSYENPKEILRIS